MTERDGFTLFLFYGVNLAAAGAAVFSAFTHPEESLPAVIVGTIMIFAGANLVAFFHWLRYRRRPVVVLTRRNVCWRLALVNPLGAVLLFALYERGASSAYLWYVGGAFVLMDATVVSEYFWQRSFRARLRRNETPCAGKPTSGR